MMQRIRYAIYNALRHKKNLYQYLVNPALRSSSVTELTPDYFNARGIKYIVLDFDGVLANHGEVKPLAEAEAWLNNITKIIPESHFALLSNKPFAQRLQYFQKRFPNIVVITGVAKKPYPEGLNQLVEHFKCPKNELALVDDRLLTGMLAVCLACVQGIYIEKAYRNRKENLMVEGFFALLRKGEREWIRWLET